MGFLPLAGLAVSAVGSLLSAKSANDRQNSAARAAQGQMEPGPSSLEQMISQMLGQTGLPNFNAKNISTDPFAQALRGSAGTGYQDSAAGALQGLLGNNGNPFDTSGMFAALAPLEHQQQTQGLAALNSNAGSFGKRYGSSNSMGASNFLASLAAQTNLQHSQIQQSAFNDAQNRVLQATGQLGQLGSSENSQLLSALGLGQQSAAQQGNFVANLLGLLGQNMQQRQNRNAGLLGAANPTNPNPIFGALGGLGNTAAVAPTLLPLLGGGLPGVPSFGGSGIPVPSMPTPMLPNLWGGIS